MKEFEGTIDMDITPKMEKHFRLFLSDHVLSVTENAARLADAGLIDGMTLASIALNHDKSKLSEPEYTPYVKRVWLERESNKELYRAMGDDVKNAIVHHVTTNPHHPEYWSDDYRGFETTEPCHVSDMPERYVVEMVCDWVAMGEAHGNTARDWYNKVKDTRWIFDDSTDAKIRHWISVFENLEEN